MKKIKIVIISTILIFSYIYISYLNFKNNILIKENKIIEIKSWDTLKDLAWKLDLNYYFLKYYLKWKDFKLLKWRFEIKANSKINNILNNLKKPLPKKEIKITILEWWNIFDIDNYLTKKWLINPWKYISYVENPNKIKALSRFYKFLNPNLQTLEWYLYPDTYKLEYPLEINKLVIKQLDNFENKVYKKLLLNKTQKEIQEIITLASIVEKEEKNETQKATVAWILKKRLKAWWNIWADITVCYPHRLTQEECKMVVSKYIYEKSDYNTRVIKWLPKTPICNPQFSSIKAVIYPKKSPYWFYLHNTKTGKIYYSKTNAEHEANKKYMH